ncbi:MAG: tetratricopeptide repeat protein [Chloroflexi bacterium]|nr:tetratricopeptide repeat protein [Chloroflexota bacterium]
MTPFNADYLHQLSSLIAERTGLNTYEHRRERLVEILQLHPEALHYPASFLERLLLLPDGHPLWQALLAELTIGETYFMRDEAQIAALRDEILPTLIQEKRRQKNFTLYLWSAGCATGEEPYTLAILLNDLLPDLDRWHIQIIGTDINEAALEIARVGRYREWSLRGTPISLRQRFFSPFEQHEPPTYTLPVFEIRPELKTIVNFQHGNLLGDALFPAQQDIVLCRNVLMYFTQPQREKMEQRLLQAVRSGGWLLLSPAESLTQTRPHYSTHYLNGALAHQKNNGDGNVKNPAKNYAMNLAVFTPQAEIDPKLTTQEIENRYRVAVTAMQAGRLEIAMRLAQQALADRPYSPAVHTLIGSILASWGEADRAHSHLKQALELDTLYADAHYLMGLMQLEAGDYPSARASLRAAIYCRPDFPLAFLVSGDLFKLEGDLIRATHAWETARRFGGFLPPTMPLSDVADVTAEQLIRLVENRLNTSA